MNFPLSSNTATRSEARLGRITWREGRIKGREGRIKERDRESEKENDGEEKRGRQRERMELEPGIKCNTEISS